MEDGSIVGAQLVSVNNIEREQTDADNNEMGTTKPENSSQTQHENSAEAQTENLPGIQNGSQPPVVQHGDFIEPVTENELENPAEPQSENLPEGQLENLLEAQSANPSEAQPDDPAASTAPQHRRLRQPPPERLHFFIMHPMIRLILCVIWLMVSLDLMIRNSLIYKDLRGRNHNNTQ